jgi:hypothetical protein
MKHSMRGVVAFVMLGMFAAIPARGQAGQGDFDSRAFEEKAKQLLQQMRQPDVDQQQIQQQMRDLMQQFRDSTASLPPDKVDKLRQEMMQRLQPELIKSMPSIIRRMQQGIMDRIKPQLECTEEEFATLRPGLQKILDAMQSATPPGPRGGFRGAPMPGQSQPLSLAFQELHATLQDASAKPDAIKARLDSVRLARESADHDLAVARAELRPLLTVRQEAVLVVNGLME